jgi:hypothetical protein
MLSTLEPDQKRLVTGRMAQLGINVPTNINPTADQTKAAGFATSMSQADTAINDAINAKVGGAGGMSGIGSITAGIEGALPQALKSQAQQKLDQATDMFLNAVLRQEGGRLTPEQRAAGTREFIPQPGDSPSAIADKAKARATAIQSAQNDSQSTLQNGDPLKLGFNNALSTAKNGSGSLTVANPNPGKVIGGYDFTNYATDPNWGNGVKSVLGALPQMQNANDVTAYIQKVAPKSQITGSMIIASAQKYGVNPVLMLAISQHESGLGTLGAGANTYNPGNVGNVDSGGRVNQGSWQSGLDALARNISERHLTA